MRDDKPNGTTTAPVATPAPEMRGSLPPAPPRLPLSLFAYRTLIVVLIAVVILAITAFLWFGIHTLLLAFGGILFAVFLHGLADWLAHHTRLSYRVSLTVVLIALFLIAGGFGYLTWSRLSTQVSQMTETLPQSFQRIRHYLEQTTWGKYLVENVPKAATGMVTGGQFTQVTGLISGVAGFFEAVILILVVGIFGAAEPGLYRAGFLHLIPARERPRVGEAVEAVFYNLRYWLLGQVLLMIIIGVTTTVGLWIIGIPLALTLGLMAGILEMIPYIGAWIAAVPAALIALLKGPHYLVYVLFLYLFLHCLEGYILLPLIQRRSVHLPPALTLVAQVLMGNLLGFVGIFVAAPFTVAIMILLKMLYVEDTLGDEAVNVPGEPAG